MSFKCIPSDELIFSGMVYHFSDLFEYISTESKEGLAVWQVKSEHELPIPKQRYHYFTE